MKSQFPTNNSPEILTQPTRTEAVFSVLKASESDPWTLYPHGQEIDDLDYYYLYGRRGNPLPFIQKYDLKLFTLSRIISTKTLSRITGKSISRTAQIIRRVKYQLSGGFNYKYYSNKKFTLKDNELVVKKVSL